MPVDVTVGQILAGYNLHTIKEGEEATLVTRELVSSEDADLYRMRVDDGIPRILLSLLPEDKAKELLPVRYMVAILREDMTATLYLDTIPNDLNPFLHVTPKRAWGVGEPVTPDDIAEVEKLEYRGISFPPDAGILVLFKAGDQNGFFYDLTPLVEGRERREFDVEKSLGYFFCYLSQQHLFKIDDADWQYMFASQWFPFITLTVKTRQQLVEGAKARVPLDDLLPTIAQELKAHSENLRTRIKGHSVFSPHATLLEHALDKYVEGDYISSTAIIYPRIEGIMRSLHRLSGLQTRATQSALADVTVQARNNVDKSGILLLPEKFRSYLEDVYFANFDPTAPAVLSRNSVGHGVAEQADYNQKAATIGLLIIDQISYFLPDESTNP
jgi:hypothetical protein